MIKGIVMSYDWDTYKSVSDKAPGKPWVAETTSWDPFNDPEGKLIRNTGIILGYNPDAPDGDPFEEIARVEGCDEVIDFIATASEALPNALALLKRIEVLHAPVELRGIDDEIVETVCAECCLHENGLTDDCAINHEHVSEPLLRCETIRSLYGLDEEEQ